LAVGGRRKCLSNIYKGHEAQDILIQPYELKEVTQTALGEETDFNGFERLNGPAKQPEDGEFAPLVEETKFGQPGREQIDHIEKEAYEKAFQLGEKAGLESGERMFRSAVQSLVEAAEGLKHTEREFYGRVEEEILDLVLATTRKVVQREVNTQRDVILEVLRQAIAKTIDRERIRIRINPSDFDFVHAHKSDIASTVDGVKDLVIEGDESISRGGAVVDSDYGTIDARIERRFEAVEKALRRQRDGKDDAIKRDHSDHRENERAN
jgi:flagellar biosynthesis/type III secretory pathway protein FliH